MTTNTELLTMREYRAALDAFDWQYEMADDHQAWARGTNALARLRRMQLQVDPDGSIWGAHPGAQCFGAPHPIVRSAA